MQAEFAARLKYGRRFSSESATWRRSDRRAASPEKTVSSWLTELVGTTRH